jgi:hypothetical protein
MRKKECSRVCIISYNAKIYIGALNYKSGGKDDKTGCLAYSCVLSLYQLQQTCSSSRTHNPSSSCLRRWEVEQQNTANIGKNRRR